jgi:hypothetical protein
MCDYSLAHLKSRPAAVGDKLVTHNFGSGTRGFAPQDHNEAVAVCVLPGTEIAFDEDIKSHAPYQYRGPVAEHKVAIFRQINLDKPRMHHDALELPTGTHIMLTGLVEGQKATVLQLPAAPKNEAERKAQERLPMAELVSRSMLERLFG